MKKWLLMGLSAVMVLFVGTVFLFPLGVGFFVQTKYPQMLQALSNSGDVQLKLLSYHRGWFNSEAAVQVKLAHPSLLKLSDWVSTDSEQPPIEFVITQNIEHGPWLVVTTHKGNSRLFFGQAMIKSHINPSMGDIDSMTLVKLGGSILTVLSAPDIKYVNKKEGVVAGLSGLTATLNLSPKLTEITGQVKLPRIMLRTNDYQQKISGLSARYKLFTSNSGLFLGDRFTKIDNVTWSTAEQHSKIKLNGLAMQSRSNEKQGRVNYELKAVLNTINLNDADYGPQQIDFAVKNLDIPGLLTLRQQLGQLQSNTHLSSMQLMKYNELFMMLLSKGLELDLRKIQLVTPWGKPFVVGRLILHPQTSLAMNMDTFLTYMDAKLHMEIPGPIMVQTLEKLNQTALGKELGLADATDADKTGDVTAVIRQRVKDKLTNWVENNLLIAQQDGYLFDLLFQNDKAYINGQPYHKQEAAETINIPTETS